MIPAEMDFETADDEIIICCILGLCCAPGSAQQVQATAAYLARKIGDTATKDMLPAAKALLATFDLVPQGSLAEFRRIARTRIAAR